MPYIDVTKFHKIVILFHCNRMLITLFLTENIQTNDKLEIR